LLRFYPGKNLYRHGNLCTWDQHCIWDNQSNQNQIWSNDMFHSKRPDYLASADAYQQSPSSQHQWNKLDQYLDCRLYFQSWCQLDKYQFPYCFLGWQKQPLKAFWIFWPSILNLKKMSIPFRLTVGVDWYGISFLKFFLIIFHLPMFLINFFQYFSTDFFGLMFIQIPWFFHQFYVQN